MEEIEYLFSKNMQYIGIAGLCVAVIQVNCQSSSVFEFGPLFDSFCMH